MWRESQAGLYQRPIGENERFIKFIGDRAHRIGREHWSVTAQATFRLREGSTTSMGEDIHRRSWQALRFEHPSIAVTAADGILSYEVPDTNTLAAWTKETFIVHHNGSSQDVVSSLRPSHFVTAHLIPHEATIILHFAHWRTDGYGALQLVNSYMDHLCQVLAGKQLSLQWGEETSRLTPSVEEVLSIPTEPTQNILESTKRYMATLALTRGTVGVHQICKPDAAPCGTRSCRLDLTKADTLAMEAACKEQSISVLSAVHASCAALTYSEAATTDQGMPYTSTMRFSLRPYLPPPYDSAKYAAALYTGGFMEQVPATQSWLANAKGYQQIYSQGLSDDFLQCRRQYAIEVFDVIQKATPATTPIASEIDISSVGNAEELIGRRFDCGEASIEVVDINIGVETLTRQMYCFLWTFRDQLGFNLVYNEAFYEPKRVLRLVQRLKDILLTELKVKS